MPTELRPAPIGHMPPVILDVLTALALHGGSGCVQAIDIAKHAGQHPDTTADILEHLRTNGWAATMGTQPAQWIITATEQNEDNSNAKHATTTSITTTEQQTCPNGES